ncbi:hypothetical protein B0A50_00670 [Salinomyces thailandicus]|uniref:Protein kinase domain-containing protein n=1 Tax=Salinomyces thailandicus TaxID=706561 RepID=A0A4U0UD02_9PEZI|nr:hypothetical protein B0A50_00670 [Salinomyces thailandica]
MSDTAMSDIEKPSHEDISSRDKRRALKARNKRFNDLVEGLDKTSDCLPPEYVDTVLVGLKGAIENAQGSDSAVLSASRKLRDNFDRQIDSLETSTEKEADKLENKIVRLENKRELAFEKLNALDFRRNKYDMALSWVGDWQFSEKGASEAPRLWVKEDMNGSIIDRVVIKDTRMKRQRWKDKRNFFSKFPRPPHPNAREIPNEIVAMLALSSCEGLENPVIIRDWRMATKRKTYRIYMEYAPRGDLYQWMRRYRPSLPSPLESLTARFPDPTDEQIEQYDAEKEQHDEKVREFHAVRDTREREWLPEAWIWHCFESLEKAVVLMAQGTLAPDPPDPWEPIIHLDWKPSNVLEWEKDEDGDPEVLQEPNFRESTRNKYSKELRDLVLDCTKYEQSDRPTPVQVFDRVKQYFARQSAADPEGALRSAPKDDPIWNRPNFVLDFVKDDKWPLWGPLSSGDRVVEPCGRVGQYANAPSWAKAIKS